LLLIGALVMVSFMAEGVMCDWSVLFLRQELAQPEALAGLGYALFAGAMAGARFGTDGLRARFGEGPLLRTGGGLCALAMTLALAVSLGRSLPALAYLGIALVGVGLAPSVPILLKAATRVPGASSAAALSSVSSVGYLGFLLGPSLIGALSKAFSLTSALGVVVLAGLLLALVPLALESRAEAGE
jgi:hypothetical protein